MIINPALESIYQHHHTTARGRDFMVLGKERGAFLRKHIGINKEVLDIGCRDGELTNTYAKGNRVFGLDIDGEALDIATKKITSFIGMQVDLNGDWGVPSNSFDVVVACEVMEHLYYPHKVCERIVTVLKPGGLLVGSIPHAFSLQTRIKFLFGTKDSTPLSDPTHINHFSYKEFKAILEQYFEDIIIEGICTKRYSWLTAIAPFLFAHTLLFKARKPRS